MKLSCGVPGLGRPIAMIAGVLSILGCAKTADTSDAAKNLPSATYPYPAAGVILGQGWDTFNDAGTQSSCVEVAPVRLERESYKSEVEQIQSTYSLLKEQTTTVSAAYNGVNAKASGDSSTTKRRQINSDDQNFIFRFESRSGSTFAVAPETLADAAVDRGTLENLLQGVKSQDLQERLAALLSQQPRPLRGGNVRLTAETKKLLSAPSTRSEFVRKCGEGYVAAIHRGVRIEVLLTQTAASALERDSLSIALSASGWGARGSYKSTSTVTTELSTTKLGYRTFQEGGVPLRATAITTTKGDVRTPASVNLSEFLPRPEALLANPTAFSVTVVPYANIDTEAASVLPTPLDLLNVSDYYIALNDIYVVLSDMLTAERASTSSTANDAAQKVSGRVDAVVLKSMGGTSRLAELRDMMTSDLAFLEGLLEQCYAVAKRGHDASPPQASGNQRVPLIDRCTVAGAIASAKGQIDKDTEKQKEAAIAAREAVASATKVLKSFNVPALVDLTELNTQFLRAQVAQMKGQMTVSTAKPGANDAGTKQVFSAEQLQAAEDLESARTIEDAYDRYLDRIEAYAEALEQKQLTEDFFYRFYWYLVQIPLPEVDYKPTLTYATEKEAQDKVADINRIFPAAVFARRIEPWKNFFCREKSGPLCIPDVALNELLTAAAFTVDKKDLTYTPPPAPHKKKDKCKKTLIKVNC